MATIKPAVLQVEMNPRNNQHAPKDQHALKAEFADLAAKYDKSPSQVIIRWHLQESNVVFPKTTNPAHMAENLDVFDFVLAADEVAAIDAMPQKPYYHMSEEAPAWVWGPHDYSKQA